MPEHRFTHVSLQQRGELPLLRIANRAAQATIALQGAQLLEYTPRGERPVVWLSKLAEYRRGQPVRGGIPVCWPWFGALGRNPAPVRGMATGSELPAHGLVRDRDWTLREVREFDDRTELTLAFVTDSQTQRHWPQAAELVLQFSIGATLQLRLTTRNLGERPLALTQALHTYFAVGAIDTVRVTGFEQTRYVDTLDGWREKHQQGPITCQGETDRIHLQVPAAMQLEDGRWQRRIAIASEGSASAVVWNPWVDKCRRMSQLASDAWREFLCIETANVLEDQLLLAPGESRTLGLRIEAAPAQSGAGTDRGNSGR